MEKYENFTQPLTDEELMELAGGFSNLALALYPVPYLTYGLGPLLDSIKRAAAVVAATTVAGAVIGAGYKA